MNITPHQLAGNLMKDGGIEELAELGDHPFIQWAHMLCDDQENPNHPDELAWCSSLANAVCHILSLPRSRSKMARSWLNVGRHVGLLDARVGFDVVVLWRGERHGPLGHVGFFGGLVSALAPNSLVRVRGGNQSNRLSDALYPTDQVLDVRRLVESTTESED